MLVDGVDVREYSLKNLREGVGMVLQKNVLFSGTIEENLRWGNEDASMEELYQAAENAVPWVCDLVWGRVRHGSGPGRR